MIISTTMFTTNATAKWHKDYKTLKITTFMTDVLMAGKLNEQGDNP